MKLDPNKILLENENLTHLDKIYWPEENYTKGNLLEYYRLMAPYILPYLKKRPQSLHRFPNGIKGEEFFQKNVDPHFPDWIATCNIKHSDKEIRYLIINDAKSLLFAVNLGCIDLNPFNAHLPSLDYPDYLVIDLDPDNLSFDSVIDTAQVYHEILQSKEIPHFCKTSGATGLHIYVPLHAKYTHEQTKQFAEILAQLVHAQLPHITSLERMPSKRKGLIYLDYLQNRFGQTMASVYSVRPRPKAPVSTPLEWTEVKYGLDPQKFNIQNTYERIKKKGDLFFPVLGKGIDLLKCLKKII